MTKIIFNLRKKYSSKNCLLKSGYNMASLGNIACFWVVLLLISPFQLCRSWHLQGWSTCDVWFPPSSLALHPHPLSPASLESLSLQDPVPGNHPPLKWVTWIRISNIMTHTNQQTIPGKKVEHWEFPSVHPSIYLHWPTE